MVKITLDMDTCQHYGQCCFEAEDVFKLDDAGKLVYVIEVDESRRGAVEAAADVCPMQAITVE
jgi:ferredoxin